MVLIYQPPNAHVRISWNGGRDREKDLYTQTVSL
jgi:hypothetical protein